MMKTESTDSFKTAIEHALSFVIAADDAPTWTTGSERVAAVAGDVDLGYFSVLEPLQHRLLMSMPPSSTDRSIPANPFLSYPSDAAREAKSFDISWITDTINDDGSPSLRDRFSLSRVRSVPASRLRGRVNGSSDVNVEFTSALVKRDLSFSTTRTYLVKAGTRFQALEYTDARVSRLTQSAQKSLEAATTMALGIAVARHYSWAVTLGFPGSPSINLMTDPTGALELLALRDVSKGSRRDALVHWVSEHWRRRCKDPSSFSRVKAHLRGKTFIEWDGLHCEVVPSLADVASCSQGGGPVTAPWERDDRPEAS